MGLREGPIGQELRRQVWKTPGLSFNKVKMEALALEEEQDEQWPLSTCLTSNKRMPCSQPTVTDWKQEFWNEILRELKVQMTGMTKTILAELRDNGRHDTFSPQSLRPRPHSNNFSRDRFRARTLGGPSNYKWDPQGHPICNTCTEAGHFSRNCPSKSATQDF